MIMLNSKSSGIAVIITIRMGVSALLYSNEICWETSYLLQCKCYFARAKFTHFVFSLYFHYTVTKQVGDK